MSTPRTVPVTVRSSANWTSTLVALADHVGVRHDRAVLVDDEAGAGAALGADRHDGGAGGLVDRGDVALLLGGDGRARGRRAGAAAGGASPVSTRPSPKAPAVTSVAETRPPATAAPKRPERREAGGGGSGRGGRRRRRGLGARLRHADAAALGRVAVQPEERIGHGRRGCGPCVRSG